jgi:hypothetical protein
MQDDDVTGLRRPDDPVSTAMTRLGLRGRLHHADRAIGTGADTLGGVGDRRAPRAQRLDLRRSMSCTISGKPCLTRFRDMGRPMLPRPMKPTDPAITSSWRHGRAASTVIVTVPTVN